MTILLAEPNIERLRSIAIMLHDVAPDFFVLSASDPLMAAKFVFDRHADILIAELNMPRINGVQLSEFVRTKNPDAKLCLMGAPEEFARCKEPFSAEIVRLTYPITKETLACVISRMN